MYPEDNYWVWRLSSWGRCPRELVACRKGIVAMPPPKGEAAPHLREGHLHEKDVIKQLRANSYQVTNEQSTVELEFGDNVIRGHLDGRVSVLGIKPQPLEVKALGKTEFKKMKALGVKAWIATKPEYAWQVSGSMLVDDSPALYVVKSRDSGEVVQETIEEPFFGWEDFQARLDELLSWLGKDGFPECSKTGWCWNGPYRQVHYRQGKEDEEPVPFRRLQEKQIDVLAERLYDARLKKAAAEQVEQDIKDELLALIGPGDYDTERLTVKVKNVPTRRLDTKAVRRDHGDAYDVMYEYAKVSVEPKG